MHLKQSEKQKVPKRSGECGMRTGLCGRRHYETRESEFRITQTTIIKTERKKHTLRGSKTGGPQNLKTEQKELHVKADKSGTAISQDVSDFSESINKAGEFIKSMAEHLLGADKDPS